MKSILADRFAGQESDFLGNARRVKRIGRPKLATLLNREIDAIVGKHLIALRDQMAHVVQVVNSIQRDQRRIEREAAERRAQGAKERAEEEAIRKEQAKATHPFHEPKGSVIN